MRKLEKDNGLEMLEISIVFSSQKIDKQLLVIFEYLTVSLDKISKTIKKIILKMMSFFSFI